MATLAVRVMLAPALFVLSLAVAAAAQADDQFTPPCALPFATIAQKHDIDRTCGPGGDTESGPHAAQNRAKNNFCATGLPVPVTYEIFKALQRAVDKAGIPYGSSNKLPPDRDALTEILKLSSGKTVGEGTIVRYVAFISHPRNSNLRKGESVNCKEPGAEANDIHIDLLRRPNDGEPACRSVTAEISPHYRPEYWEAPKLRLLRDRPVRITGQLFFDASHRPCRSDNDKANPKRISLWEIHPVYQIDVCRLDTLKACTVTGDHWVPLSDWSNKEQEEDEH